jgi:hypothetical protein
MSWELVPVEPVSQPVMRAILPFRFWFRAHWLVPLRLECDRTDAER